MSDMSFLPRHQISGRCTSNGEWRRKLSVAVRSGSTSIQVKTSGKCALSEDGGTIPTCKLQRMDPSERYQKYREPRNQGVLYKLGG